MRIRSGTDIPFLFGLLYHIFKNGWEDQAYIDARVYGMDEVKADILAKWSPDKVRKPVAWTRPRCIGGQDHAREPARHAGVVHGPDPALHRQRHGAPSCIVQLALGNVGKSGGGANIFRGHDNVQGATDVGPNPDSLPGYYGLAEGSWKHFANTWGVDYEWIKGPVRIAGHDD